MYTLKQACQILNLTEHTIRYYTDIGIVEVKRDKIIIVYLMSKHSIGLKELNI